MTVAPRCEPTQTFSHRRFIAGAASTSDLADLIGDAVRSCDTQLRDFGGRTRFAGRVRTVRSYEDNALLRQTLSTPGDGGVLVVDTAGSVRVAMMGDFYADLARTNGWAGVIVHGAIRDVAALAALDLGVKALGSNPRKSRKENDGAVEVPVRFGGVTFHPGEYVYADEDGVVVVGAPIG